MMDPVTQVTSFSIKSHDVSQQLSQVLNDTILQQPGCLRVRWSLLHEDATKLRCFIDWENISLHEQFAASASHHIFLDKLSPFIESAPQSHHVEFLPMPSSLLDNEGGKGKTPVVEVAYMHFLGDDSFSPEMKNKAWSNVEQFLAESAPLAKGSTGETAMGWTIEQVDFKGEKCRALVWVGELRSSSNYRKSEAFAEKMPLLQRTAGLKGLSVVHVSFTTTERRD